MIAIFLMNFLFAVSTTIGMAFIPFLITDHLSFSLTFLALVEGSTEFISNILRLVTGTMFDRIKNKRLLFVIPAFAALLSKAVLFLPSSLFILFGKMTERIANGAFAAPRDAYIGQNAKQRGKALSILNISKTVGCILGPLIVSAVVYFCGSLKDNIMLIILLATLVNVLSLFLSFTIKTSEDFNVSTKSDFNIENVKSILVKLKPLLILSSLFFFARFNDGMIAIFLKNQGFPEWFYLSTISFFNAVILPVSLLLGYLVDKNKIYTALKLTITSLLLFNLCYLNIKGVNWILACAGLAFWGAQRAGAQITFSAILFKNIPKKFYGTAIGLYSILTGASAFASALICGKLGSESFYKVFTFTGVVSLVTLVYSAYLIKKKII